MGANRRGRRRAILLDHGVGNPVGKAPVGLVVHLDELEGQVRFELIDDEPRPAVAGVHDDFQGLELAHSDVGEEVRDIRRQGVERRACAAMWGLRKLRALREAANVFETVVDADGPRLLAHEFHAVVVGRVVAGGDHDAAVKAAVERGEVHAFRAADPDVVDIGAAVGQGTAHGVGESGAGEPDVAADHHALGREELGIAASDAVRNLIIKFTGNPAA